MSDSIPTEEEVPFMSLHYLAPQQIYTVILCVIFDPPPKVSLSTVEK
jgi:hypothetical protein